MAVPIGGWLRGAVGRVGRDFGMMRSAWRTTWALRRLDREAVVQRPALADVCRALGEAACRQGAGGDLAPMQDVTKHAEALAQAEADLKEREEAVASAQTALELARAAHTERVAPLEEAYRPLAEAQAAARSGLQASERELGDLKSRLDRIEAEIGGARVGRPISAPVEELQRQVEELKQAQAASEARRASAAEELKPHEGKAAEARQALEAAQREAAEEDARFSAELQAAESARDEARSTAETRRVYLGRAHTDLGAAIVESGHEPEGLHEEFAAAQTAHSRAAAVDAQMVELRRERDAAKGGAARFALYLVGALVAVVAAVLIVWHLAAPAPPPPADADVDCY